MIDELGDRRDRPDTLAGLGRALQRQSDLERAIALYQESLAIARETGDQRGIAQALLRLGDAAWQQGNIGPALKLTRQALAVFDAMGNLIHIASSVEAIAVLATAQGEARLAARLLGAAAGLLERVGAAIQNSERFAHDDAATRVRESLGDEAFTAAWETGRALTQEQTVAEALAWADAAI
jgi:tetratricopeptide (TPR) repeat protein